MNNNYENMGAGSNVVEELGFTTLESINGSLEKVEGLIATFGEDADLAKIKSNLEIQKAQKEAEQN